MNTPKKYEKPCIPGGPAWDLNIRYAGPSEDIIPIGNGDIGRIAAFHVSDAHAFYVETSDNDHGRSTVHNLSREGLIDAAKDVLLYYGVPFCNKVTPQKKERTRCQRGE